MGSIDRIIYYPVLALAPPIKSKVGGNGGKGTHEPWGNDKFKPLRRIRASPKACVNTPYATGCDEYDDCLSCPEYMARKCPLRLAGKDKFYKRSKPRL